MVPGKVSVEFTAVCLYPKKIMSTPVTQVVWLPTIAAVRIELSCKTWFWALILASLSCGDLSPTWGDLADVGSGEAPERMGPCALWLRCWDPPEREGGESHSRWTSDTLCQMWTYFHSGNKAEEISRHPCWCSRLKIPPFQPVLKVNDKQPQPLLTVRKLDTVFTFYPQTAIILEGGQYSKMALSW